MSSDSVYKLTHVGYYEKQIFPEITSYLKNKINIK